MKLKALQTYQAVHWQKSNTNFISNARKGHESTTITLKDGYVHIKSDTDEIIVFPANIAFAIPADAVAKADTEIKIRDVKAKA
jgi:hypothetical protein